MNASTMEPHLIDISSLKPADVLMALYNVSLDWLGKPPTKKMTREEAQAEIEAVLAKPGRAMSLDYVRNRSCKFHFGKPLLDTRLFDRDNGQGAAAAALAPLLAKPAPATTDD